MSFPLERFQIIGLHGFRTVDITLSDGKLVLVGENGTGKTTIVNFIYFFLTRQWNRMAAYRFEAIRVTFSSASKPFDFSRDDILSGTVKSSKPLGRHRRLPMSIRRRIDALIAHQPPSEILHSEALREDVSLQLGIPEGVLLEYLLEVVDYDESATSENILEMNELLRDTISEQILYLPTYRRIEKDLQNIFPWLDFDEFRYRSRRFRGHKSDPADEPHIELVEFGMEDVEQTIDRVMSKLTETLRKSLNDLTWTYLREVIKGEYNKVDPTPLRNLPEGTMNAILEKVDEKLLPNEQKQELTSIIESLKSNVEIGEADNVVTHFLVRLVDLHRKQEEDEQSVVEFVNVCNGYLNGKRLTFDNTQFEINIVHSPDRDESEKSIRMSMLSSGEKQIVSLFSHIYLSGRESFFVIIDEPELSLSVDWQRKFLPDIFSTKKCSGLVAVTHSPFVFDNSLDSYAHDVKKFWI